MQEDSRNAVKALYTDNCRDNGDEALLYLAFSMFKTLHFLVEIMYAWLWALKLDGWDQMAARRNRILCEFGFPGSLSEVDRRRLKWEIRHTWFFEGWELIFWGVGDCLVSFWIVPRFSWALPTQDGIRCRLSGFERTAQLAGKNRPLISHPGNAFGPVGCRKGGFS